MRHLQALENPFHQSDNGTAKRDDENHGSSASKNNTEVASIASSPTSSSSDHQIKDEHAKNDADLVGFLEEVDLLTSFGVFHQLWSVMYSVRSRRRRE